MMLIANKQISRRPVRKRRVKKLKARPQDPLQRLELAVWRAIMKFGDVDIAAILVKAQNCPEFKNAPARSRMMSRLMGTYLLARLELSRV